MRIPIFKFVLVLSITALSFSSVAQTQQDTIYAYLTKTPVAIDGSDIDPCWAEADWQPISKVWLPYYGAPMEEGDFSGRFKLAWDSLYLYLLAEITDDSISDDHANPLQNWWDDDCLEIFIDENRSKGWHEKNNNAFAYHVSIFYDAIDESSTGAGINYRDNIEVIMDTISEHKYLWEVAIKNYDESFDLNNPEDSRVYLYHHKLMGFSLAYCDNDETNSRENFIGSTDMPAAHSNDNYITADYFGTLLLVDPNFQESNAVKDISQKNELKVFPNPASDYIILQLNAENSINNQVEILDLNGRIILEVKNIHSGQRISVEQLPKGLYTLQYQTESSRNKTIFMKQ